jgi:adenylosuccinate lyase
MSHLFSPEFKFRTWRRLWIALAEAEMKLGLPITQAQIEELRAFADDVNYSVAEAQEKKVRHDVMSHVYAYGQQAKSAAGIIHLGATSAYVGDNTDVIQMREALGMLRIKLAKLIKELSKFALKYKDLPTLGFTHFQPAQLVTVGKRASLWIQDFYYDYLEVCFMMESLPLLGVKGTTGTQASFLDLFDGDARKVKKLEELVVKKMGFASAVAVSGQTYTRKLDTRVLSVLVGIAESASKMTNDIRLLQHLKEVEEPFEKSQIGSSAMAYKRNPMRSERVASLSRYIINAAGTAAATEAAQWFERTLDDSAARRIVIPETFMAADAVIDILRNVSSGLVVYPKVIRAHVDAEIPFMATENIIMEGVKRGGDRQDLHERIRVHSMEAGRVVKEKGLPNDLLSRIAGDPAFGLSAADVAGLTDPALYTGLSALQTEEFLNGVVLPAVGKDARAKLPEVELKV